MNINYDSLAMMAKYAVIMMGLLMLVFLLAVLTPKAAKIIDRFLLKFKKGNSIPPERVEKDLIAEKSAEIKGLYDAQVPEENAVACQEDNGKELDDEQRN